MPKLPIDYSKTVIYKIVCKDLNVTDIYIGNTTQFTKRKHQHCHNASSGLINTKLYQFIQKNGGWNNWDMIEIEKFNCQDCNEARARERHWYEQLNANLNSQKPIKYKSDKTEYLSKYYQSNREKLIENANRYKAKNYEKVKEYQINYKNSNKSIKCECGGKYKDKTVHFKTKMHKKFEDKILI